MVSRGRIRLIRSARCYTIAEAAELLKVSINTIRNWGRAGLLILQDSRPFLIPGEVMKDWLIMRDTARRMRMKPEQMRCMRCKSHETPLGCLVDCMPQSGGKLMLKGFCPTCGGMMHRIIGARQLPGFASVFDIAYPAENTLSDTPIPG